MTLNTRLRAGLFVFFALISAPLTASTIALEGHQRTLSGRPTATIANYNLVKGEKYRSDPVSTVAIDLNYQNTLHFYKEQVAGRNAKELDNYSAANKGDFQTAYDVMSFGLTGDKVTIDYTNWTFLARNDKTLNFLREEYLFLGLLIDAKRDTLEQLKMNSSAGKVGLFKVRLRQQGVDTNGNLGVGEDLQGGYGIMAHIDNKLIPFSRFGLPIDRAGILIDDIKLTHSGAIGSAHGRIALGFAGYGDGFYWKIKRGLDFMLGEESYSAQGEDPKSTYSRVDYITLTIGARF